MITDNVAVSIDISIGLNRMNCTGCESAYENSTAGCNKRDIHTLNVNTVLTMSRSIHDYGYKHVTDRKNLNHQP